MEQNIFDWVLSIPNLLGQFSTWLFTELPYIHLSPIGMLTIGGLGTILVLHLIHLINVVGG